MDKALFDAETGERISIQVLLNGKRLTVDVEPMKRLSETLRDEFGLTSVKVGCDAGDCGACTVLLSGQQVCACMTPSARAHDRMVITLEGMARHGVWSRIQQALLRHGAAQCGVCMPGMVMAAAQIIGLKEAPSEREVMDAMGGVLCRCTGYRKIVEAVLDSTGMAPPLAAELGRAVGARLSHLDGRAKLDGSAQYGADGIPADALWLKVIRSPHHRARFTLGDLAAVVRDHPGIERILSAADVPGSNGFGVYPELRDQPVLAAGVVRYRGDAVLAVLGEREALRALRPEELPIDFVPETPVTGVEAALADGAAAVQANWPDNILIHGLVRTGDAAGALAAAAYTAEGVFDTGFVEHAYIEPEAGYALPDGDGVILHVSTQSPYLDRDVTADVLGLAPDQVRIVPTACGGGFGGKLDVSVQPLIALGAWLTGRPVACVYDRPESMTASTKRHPAKIQARLGCDPDGLLTGLDFAADFDTGAYSSWGPTVASRVPVHASGPYRLPNVHARSRAVFTNAAPSGAFRGFGVPQSAIAQEALMDELARASAIDRLEFRRLNALRPGDLTATGQRLGDSVGMLDCLNALAPAWQAMQAEVARRNAANHGESDNSDGGEKRYGAGVAGMWYGIGNTGLSNPSTMRIALRADGRFLLYNGAVDIGQGSSSILPQIAADALGIHIGLIDQIVGDTGLTADAGKTSASRQTYISGRAVELAARDLRAKILRLANAGDGAALALSDHRLIIRDDGNDHEIDLRTLPALAGDDLLVGEGTFDPEASTLDENGQGKPYASYAFGAQLALVEVDIALGRTRVLRMAAAHDVGRAINPTLVEGQIQGAIAQGLGFALMEEFIPGETEDLHNYLIPTFGDMPEIEIFLIEVAEPSGPFGAKGVGEPGLVATAPAIFSAIHQATGVTVRRAPATPDRLAAAIRQVKTAENKQ